VIEVQHGQTTALQVAVSLDGFIAGPHGEYDWIIMDPTIDFAALFKEFDRPSEEWTHQISDCCTRIPR
jgi:hypothetical protein